jgi:hypothetical protein
MTLMCEVRGSHRGVAEVSGFQGYYAVLVGKYLPTSQRI